MVLFCSHVVCFIASFHRKWVGQTPEAELGLVQLVYTCLIQLFHFGVTNLGIIRGNPGVKNLNPYPTHHKPLPLVKGKGFGGSGSGFWRVEGYKGFVKGFILNALSNYKYKLLTSLLTICKVI